VPAYGGEMKENNKNQTLEGRRSLLTGMGVAAAGLTLGAATAQAQGSGFQPARHSQDKWLDELPGDHRIFIDSSFPIGGAEALAYANNLYNAHSNAYGGKYEDLAMVVCFRHYSTGFGYVDSAWEKYGEGLSKIMSYTDPATGKAPTTNLANVTGRPELPNQGVTVNAVQEKGTQIAICDHATHVFSNVMSSMGFGSKDDIYEDLVAAAIPGSRFVSAGVIATTRSQEYGYSLLYAG